MADYLRVADGVAVEAWASPTVDGKALTPADCFHTEIASAFVPAGEGRVGMVTRDGGRTWAEPSPAPAPAPLRTVDNVALMEALTDAQRAAYGTAVKAWDQRRFQARATPFPEDNPKIVRIAAALGTTPAAWFDAAQAGVVA